MDKAAVNQILTELNEVILNTIEDTIKIADKHDFDRDETIKIMAEKFGLLAEVGTFASYEIKERGVE